MSPGRLKLPLIVATILILTGGFFVFPKNTQAATGINKQINFQGKVVNSDGTNVTNASYNFLFCIYTTASPTTACTAGANNDAIWKESKSITVTDGVFQTNLGDTTTLPGTVDFNTDNIYLGVNFNSNGQMTPLVQFTSSPYAFNADNLDGKDWTNPGTIGTSASTLSLASGGTSAWTNTAGNLTISTTTSGTLALTSAGALNLSAGAASTVSLANVTNAWNYDANTLSIDALNNRLGVGTSTPSAYLDIKASDTSAASLQINSGVAPSSPNDGDLWYDGTNLYFRNNTTSKNLLASGGAGPWTDETGISYLTDNAEDLAIGGGTLVSPFSVDVSANKVRIGSGSIASAKLDMYASDGDTGSITYTTDDTWAFEGGRVGIGTGSVTGKTERMLQVGSETNRGNTATYGEVVTKGLRDITAPLTNIKDVYVYDTTADSDGGRWIDWATTDKLSWFTESLDDGPNDACNISEDDRCYSQSFPRKAILVVTSDALYIFDAINNVMWMKFSQNSAGWALGADTNNDPSSVTALNGVIYVGTNGSAAGGLYAFDFTSDRMWNYDTTDRSGADVGIGSRNSAVTYNSDNNTNLDLGTAGTVADWGKINDVSAAVMQFSTTAITISATTNIAPNNGTTLVALATDSGLTVINLSRQRLVQYSDATDNDYNSVTITRTGKLYGLNETLGQAEKWIDIDQDQINEIAGTPTKIWDETTVPALAATAPTIIAAAPDALEVVERGSLADSGLLSTATVSGSSDLLYVGTSLGLTEIHDAVVATTATPGWSKFYDTSRQTPLMPGTIRRAHIMNETSGDLTDSSFRANTMMPVGTGITYGINGVRGKAVSIDGTTGGMFCSDNGGTACAVDTDDNMSTTGWNLSVWFKHSTTISGTDVLYSKCYNTTPAAAAACTTIYMSSTGAMVAAYDDDSTWTAYSSYDVTATSTRLYNDNQWHQAILSRNNAGAINFYIDGTPINLSTATASTLTLDVSQVVTIGGDYSATTGANFWDGAIDDFLFSGGGTTTMDVLTPSQARRLYNDARPLVNKKVYNGASDTVAYSTTTITDSSSPNWIPNEFSGQIIQITSGSGSGQTRRISSNTTNVITVSPAFSTTPANDDDFKIDPESIYGASNSVTAIGITGESAMGEARQMCVGTNSGTDTGGITCFNHQAGPNIVADVYHSNAKQLDDNNVEWTGTDYDDIQSIDVSGRAMVFGSMAHMWTETQDVQLGQGLDYLSNKIFDLTNAIKNLGQQTLAGSGSVEVGLTGGADLAEYYKSPELLEVGMIVATGDDGADTVKKTSSSYQKDILGIVSTAPGIILGTSEENSYPIALSGRVPVNVTTENGFISKGDQITSSSLAGYGMVAIETGRVIGTVLEDPDEETFSICPIEAGLPVGTKCGQVMVFVDLTDFTGLTMADLMGKNNYDASLANSDFANIFTSMAAQDLEKENSLTTENSVIKSEWTNIFQAASTLGFMKKLNDPANNIQFKSEILAKNVNASGSVVSPLIVTDTLVAKNIKAENIEGLQFIQTGIQTAQDGVMNNTAEVKNLGQQIVNLQNSVKNLSDKTSGLDQDIITELTDSNGLKISGSAEFSGSTIFKAIAEFIDKVIFRQDVEFSGRVIFNQDSAGYAVISKDERKVKVTFEKEYSVIPVVNVSLSLQKIEDKEIRESMEDILLVSDIRYIITNVTTKGFEIKIEYPSDYDVPFAWQAIAVKNVKISGSPSATPTADEMDVVNSDAEVNSSPGEDQSSVMAENSDLTIETAVDTNTSSVDAINPVEGSAEAMETENMSN